MILESIKRFPSTAARHLAFPEADIRDLDVGDVDDMEASVLGWDLEPRETNTP